MKRTLAGSILLAIALSTAPAAASPECDADPRCTNGRGHVPGYVCLRNEANSSGNDVGNGRVCVVHPQGGDLYVYARGISNRQPVVVCQDGKQIYPEPPNPADPGYYCRGL